jgi:hypothetical protein
VGLSDVGAFLTQLPFKENAVQERIVRAVPAGTGMPVETWDSRLAENARQPMECANSPALLPQSCGQRRTGVSLLENPEIERPLFHSKQRGRLGRGIVGSLDEGGSSKQDLKERPACASSF